MKTLGKTLAAGALMASVVGGAFALSASPASADVACNRYGECWRVSRHYTTYPNSLRAMFHDDDWRKAHQHGRYHWRRDRDNDNGYWMHGRWHDFH